MLKEFIKEQVAGTHLQGNGKVLRKATIKNYQSLLKNLEAFELKTGQKLRIKNYDSLQQRGRIIEAKYWKRFYLRFSDYLFYEVDAYDNYVGITMKLMRSFFNYINNKLFIPIGNYHNRFYKTGEEIPVIVFNVERFNKLIFDKEFESNLPTHLKIKKDLLVFGCSTALRFGDLISLNQMNLERIGNKTYLLKKAAKTGVTTRVLLPNYCLDILTKYKRRKKTLFPPISNTNFNVGIRSIAKLAGWTELVGKTRSRRGEAITQLSRENNFKEYRFCDLVSSHIMRKTAITTFLQLGMHEMDVRNISGHKHNSESFYRYVSFSSALLDEQTDAAFEKLKNWCK